MKKALKWLDVNFEPLCMMILFFAMLGLITLEVLLRFIFDSGLSWSEEMSRYMFVWLIFFSISYATRNNRHIRVSIILAKMPDIVQRVVMMLSDIAFLLFSVFLFIAAVGLCEYNARVGNMAITVPFTINILYGAGVVGFILLCIRNIQNIVWKIRKWKAPLEIFENYNGDYYKNNKICFIVDPEKTQIEEEGL